MNDPRCKRDVRLFGRRLFSIVGGKHRWDRDVDAIPDETSFMRVNCTRCGFAVDGVALKNLRARLKGTFMEGAI